jgi:hypothetical protein
MDTGVEASIKYGGMQDVILTTREVEIKVNVFEVSRYPKSLPDKIIAISCDFH